MVRAYGGDHRANWEDYIPLIEFAHNPSVNSTTGFTPFRLNHGREAVSPVAFHTATHVPRPDAQRFLADYNNALTETRARVEEAHLRAALNPPTPRKLDLSSTDPFTNQYSRRTKRDADRNERNLLPISTQGVPERTPITTHSAISSDVHNARDAAGVFPRRGNWLVSYLLDFPTINGGGL